MIYFPATTTLNTLPTTYLVIFLTGKLCFLMHKVVLPWILLSFWKMVRFSGKTNVRATIGLCVMMASNSVNHLYKQKKRSESFMWFTSKRELVEH